MLKWMVPKPNWMLRHRKNTLAAHVMARHGSSIQQVSQDGSLIYLMPAQEQRQNLEELLSCLETLARLLALPRQVPSLYLTHLTHQTRLLLSIQGGLSTAQYQTVCDFYNQLVEQQQRPQPSFSNATMLKSLAQMRTQLLYGEAEKVPEQGKKGPGTFAVSLERGNWVLQSLNAHFYTLLRRHPRFLEKEGKGLAPFLRGNMVRLERLSQSRRMWNHIFSQLDETGAGELLEQLRQEPFFQLLGDGGNNVPSLSSAQEQLVHWVSGADEKRLYQLWEWVWRQRRLVQAPEGHPEIQEIFKGTNDPAVLDERLKQLAQQGGISQKRLEALRSQVKSFIQTQQRVQRLDQESRKLWEKVQQMFAARFFTQPADMRERWLTFSLEERNFAADFFSYASWEYLRQGKEDAAAKLEEHLRQSSPKIAQWLSACLSSDPSAWQSFVSRCSLQWNQVFQEWSQSPLLRQWQRRMLPEIPPEVWEKPEEKAFSAFRGRVLNLLAENGTQGADWDTQKRVSDWVEQGLILTDPAPKHLAETFQTLVWRQRQLEEGSLLPALRSFSFPTTLSRQQLEHWLRQADTALLNNISAYLISQVQEGADSSPQKLKLAEELEQILCTSPGAKSFEQHQRWQSQQILDKLEQFLRQPDSSPEVLLRPFLPQNQGGALTYFSSYLEQLSPQDLPRMDSLLQAVPYLTEQEQLLGESLRLTKEYEQELKIYLRSSAGTAVLTQPGTGPLAQKEGESLWSWMAEQLLAGMGKGQTGLLLSCYLEDLTDRLEQTPIPRWNRILEQEGTLTFLRQYAGQQQEKTVYEPVFSQLVQVLERMKKLWRQSLEEKAFSQREREKKEDDTLKTLSSLRQQLRALYRQTFSQTFFQFLETQLPLWIRGEGVRQSLDTFSSQEWFLTLDGGRIAEYLKPYVPQERQESFQQAISQLRQRIWEAEKEGSTLPVEEKVPFSDAGWLRQTLMFPQEPAVWDSGRLVEYLQQYVSEEHQESFRQAVFQLRQHVLEDGKGDKRPGGERMDLLKSLRQYAETSQQMDSFQRLTQWIADPLAHLFQQASRNGEELFEAGSQLSGTPLITTALLHNLSGQRREAMTTGLLSGERQGDFLDHEGTLSLFPGVVSGHTMTNPPVLRRNVHPVSSRDMRERFHLAGYHQSNETYFIDSQSMEMVLTGGAFPTGEGASLQYSYQNSAGSARESVRQQEERFTKLHQQLSAYEQQLETIRKKQEKLEAETMRKSDQALMEQRFYRYIEEDIRLAAKRHGFG